MGFLCVLKKIAACGSYYGRKAFQVNANLVLVGAAEGCDLLILI
jgi:hypothetical protein